MTIHPRSRGAQSVSELVERVSKRPKEPRRDAFAREHLADAQRQRERRFSLRRLSQPRAHRHGLPGGFIAERAKQLAETLDLCGAGEDLPQHQKPLLKEGLRWAGSVVNWVPKECGLCLISALLQFDLPIHRAQAEPPPARADRALQAALTDAPGDHQRP